MVDNIMTKAINVSLNAMAVCGFTYVAVTFAKWSTEAVIETGQIIKKYRNSRKEP